jgi:uncharacterized membrane protein
VGLGLGLALPAVSVGPAPDSARLGESLVAMGVGMIGVVTIVYSLLFGVVQWSASTFSPRLNLFREDPLIWRTFAAAIGLFVYCVTAALAAGRTGSVSVLVPGVAILVVLMVIAMIWALQAHAFRSLQLAYVLAAVTAKGRAVIDDIYPASLSAAPASPLPPMRRTVTWNGTPGLIQQLELRHLTAAAAEAGAAVVFRTGVGDTLLPGSPLADIHGGELPDSLVRKAIVHGPERSFDQDPLLAFRLLADIGLRALSSALNDPATAVEAIDATEGLLRQLAERDLAVTDVIDESGATRVRLSLPTWDDYLRIGVEDLLPYAATSPMALERLQRLLTSLLDLPHPAHETVAHLSERVDMGLAAHRAAVATR